MTSLFRFAALAVLAACLGGCMHVAGTVYDAATNRPLEGAVITIGHPGGIGVYERHRTNAQGRFDFQMSATDENHLYLHDGRSNPNTARRIDRSEISDNMRLTVRVIGGSPDDFPR